MRKEKMFKAALALTSALVMNVATANLDDIRLGEPAYGGSGCPAGTASVTLTEDSKSMTILFDEFLVQAGSNGKRIDRKACNLAIPVHVPQGYSFSVINVDYRGYVSLPAQAQARMSAEYFFAGSYGPRFEKLFLGRTDTDYKFSNDIGISAMTWSPCGQDAIMRVNANMLVQTNRYLEDALATVDSADFKAGIVYKFQWRRCQ